MNILAYLFLFVKGVIYGLTPFFTIELSRSYDVLDILALRFLLSLGAMWLLKTLKVIKINVGIKNFITKKHRLPNLHYLLLAALFEPILYMFFETLGISMTSSITSAVIFSLTPISSCILEWVMFKTHPTPMQGAFLGCGILGVVYIAVNTSVDGGKSSALGIIFLVLAILSGNLFCAFSKKSSGEYTAFDITYISCMLGAITFNAMNVTRHIFAGDILHYFDPYFEPENLLGFFVLGIMSTIIATAMNNYAISKVSMSTFSAFGGVSTIVTVLVGVIFGAESIHFYHLIGFPLILVRMIGVSAISIMQDKKKLKEKNEELSNSSLPPS